MEKKEPTESETLKKQAAAFLDEPIDISFDEVVTYKPKNWLEKFKLWAGLMPKTVTVEHKFQITGATLRTMIKISDLLLDMHYQPKPEIGEGQLDWAYRCVSDNAMIAVKIIAFAIHNKKGDYPAELEDLILDHCDAKTHQMIAFNIINKLDIWTFTNTITSVRTLNILQEVSLPTPAEIIAPAPSTSKEQPLINGEGLETLSTILGGISIPS